MKINKDKLLEVIVGVLFISFLAGISIMMVFMLIESLIIEIFTNSIFVTETISERFFNKYILTGNYVWRSIKIILIGLIPTLFWYFKKNKPLTEKERKLEKEAKIKVLQDFLDKEQKKNK
tara:strand:+ start:275 stop:634 length:360 start_codon:yes stop_codon:yes gene_type:complete